MLKYLGSGILVFAVYLEMYENIRWVDEWIDGYICDKVKSRIKIMSIWVLTVKFFELCCMFEICHNKMLAYKKAKLVPLMF